MHEQRVEYLPGSPFPPEHFHPAQDEYFEVESGAMLFVVDGTKTLVRAGETIEIPHGRPHKARNPSVDMSAVVRWETRPALRTTEFFATVGRMDGAGVLPSALLAHSFRDVFRATGPTGWLTPIIGRFAPLVGSRLPD